ncbi:hypothetical protein SGPA1_12677 [Streptomyces misionensis JCM 4497]
MRRGRRTPRRRPHPRLETPHRAPHRDSRHLGRLPRGCPSDGKLNEWRARAAAARYRTERSARKRMPGIRPGPDR